MTEEVLQSAKATDSVKSFVLTSSRIAICNPRGGSEYKEYSVKDWNDEAFDLAEKEQNPEVLGLLACECDEAVRKFGQVQNEQFSLEISSHVFPSVFLSFSQTLPPRWQERKLSGHLSKKKRYEDYSFSPVNFFHSPSNKVF